MGAEWIRVVEQSLERADELVRASLEGLDEDALRWRVQPEANPIGWLTWHLARVLDDHLAALAGGHGVDDQVWSRWSERFALPYPPAAFGYGHTSEEVGAFRADPALLLGYWQAVQARASEILSGLADEPDRIVDDSWDPPVTLEVRLVSLVAEANAHAGQIAYVRGLVDAR